MDDTSGRNVAMVKVSGIPLTWRALQLRKFFVKFVEDEKFEVFHFKGRRETVEVANSTPVLFKRKREVQTCLVLILRTHVAQLYKTYNKHLWDKRDHTLGRCLLTSADGWLPTGDSSSQNRVYRNIKMRNEIKASRQAGELNPPLTFPRGLVGTPSKALEQLSQTTSSSTKKRRGKSLGVSLTSKDEKVGGGRVDAEKGGEEEAADEDGEKGRAFSLRVMKAHGWTEGKGLGRLSQGMADPVEAVVRKGRGGIGFSMSAEEADMARRQANKESRIRKRAAKRRRREKASVVYS